MKKKPDVISEADIVIKIWGMAQASIKQRNSPCADNIVRQDTFKWAFAEFSRIRLKDLGQAKAEVAREIRFQILEWFRNYAHQLDRKFPHPTTEEQGWLGNIWDMIHMAGKEDFEDKWLKEAK